ncbi:ClbS/DfsB family four-helix bundle protein, partial [Rhodococcus erythropolis]|nr:ClbS/DfsB family four-helix bundle protein [Rhodococcus erythropolis]
MAQTLSREELASALDSAYSKLDALLDGVAEADAFDAVAVDAWTVHDVLAVRVWWAEAVVEWIGAGLRDETPQTPAAGYKWTQTPALNQSVVEASAGT